MIAACFSPLLADALLLASLQDNRLWYAAPLIVSVSLVYAGTRHEAPKQILAHAARFCAWVLVFMTIVTGALQLMWWLEPRPALPWWWFGVPLAGVVLWMFLSSRYRQQSADGATDESAN